MLYSVSYGTAELTTFSFNIATTLQICYSYILCDIILATSILANKLFTAICNGAA